MTFDDLWIQLLHARRSCASQVEMASWMKTTQSHISELETGVLAGTHDPGVEILERYANALGYVVIYDLKRVEEME